jgi:hypothetical protein
LSIHWRKGDCVGDGLPGPTVFEAGYNSQYIVFARHPRRWSDRIDRAVSEFYYILRRPDERTAIAISVIGPFSEAEYQQEKVRLSLPEFTKVFHDLK